MPKPKSARAKAPKAKSARSKLPAEKGIRAISLGGEADAAEGLEVHLGAADRALVDRIRADLERSHGRPFEATQIVRWALWHCRMEGE